jgi:hypothetical protein
MNVNGKKYYFFEGWFGTILQDYIISRNIRYFKTVKNMFIRYDAAFEEKNSFYD